MSTRKWHREMAIYAASLGVTGVRVEATGRHNCLRGIVGDREIRVSLSCSPSNVNADHRARASIKRAVRVSAASAA
jgi:hypothetical protein